MGYLTQKYSTIFRGPWITYMKERRLAGRITRHMHRIHKSVLTKLPQEEEEHKVTKFLKDTDALVKGRKFLFIFGKEAEFKKTGKQEFRFVFDESYQEEAVLKKIMHIEKRLEQLRAQASAEHKKEIDALEKKIDGIFAVHILKAMKKLEKEDKSEYKEVMNIINAEKTIDKETIMNWARTVPKDVDVSRWRRIPIRKDVRMFRREIGAIKRDDKGIEIINKEIETMLKGKKVKYNVKEIMKKIEALAKQLEADITIGFYEAYKGMKRVLSLMYLLTMYEIMLDSQLEDWAKQSKIPKLPAQRDIQEVRTIRADLGNKMRIIAQALRRIYQQEKGIEREATRLAT